MTDACDNTSDEYRTVALSVIVPTLGQRPTLRRTVESILADGGDDLEVLVVINGPAAATMVADLPDDSRVQMFRLHNVGVCTARNAGAQHAHGEWFAFVDDDDVVLPGWSSIVRAGCAPHVAVVFTGIQVVDENETVGSSWVPEPVEALAQELPGPMLAGNVFIRATLFHRVGGYDEALRYAENTELALRLAKSLEPGVSEAVLIDDRFLLSIERRTDRPQGSARDKYDAALHLLEHHADRLGRDPSVRANHYAIAGVSAAQLRRSADARQHLRQAVRADPWRPARWVRVAAVHLPLVRAHVLAFIEMTDTRIARAASVSSETVGRFETVRPAGAPPRIPAGRFQHWALRPA